MWLTAASVMCGSQRWHAQGLAEGLTWTIDNAVAAGAADAAGADA